MTKPDVVLLDLLMPDMTGFEVATQMASEPALRDIPVIAMSAATPGEDQLASVGAGFSLFRDGPFRPGELVALLQMALSVVTDGARAERDSD